MGSFLALSWLIASQVAFGRLQIRSDAVCPTASDVSASLRRLVGREIPTEATLTVSRGAASLDVRLVDAAGAVLAERAWPDGDCAAAADAIAVVAAAWADDVSPRSPPPLAPI